VIRFYRDSAITAIETAAYRAGHADATTELLVKHELELDGARAGFLNVAEELNGVISKSRARNQRLCTEKEQLAAIAARFRSAWRSAYRRASNHRAETRMWMRTVTATEEARDTAIADVHRLEAELTEARIHNENLRAQLGDMPTLDLGTAP
jgi:hypothetical protein